MTVLRLAVPSNGALHEPALDFLRSCGMEVKRDNSRRYTAEIPAMPGVTVHFQRAADIGLKVEEDSADMGIMGLDQYVETRREGGATRVVVERLGFGISELVLGVPDFWVDVTSVAHLAKLSAEFRDQGAELLRVANKYPRLVERFLLKNGVNYFTNVVASGTLEAAPVMGYADIIADISETGTTLRENRLKTIDGGTIMSSEACLIGGRVLQNASEGDLDLASGLVERVNAGVG